MIRTIGILLSVAVLLAAPVGAQDLGEKVVTVPLRDKEREDAKLSFILLGPRTGNPPAVILYAGGDGYVWLDGWNGKGNPSGNFLVRSRKLFARAGLLVAVPDVPTDLGSLDGWRNEVGHLEEARHILRHLRRFTKGPVFLVGTSRGSQSAVGIAALARPGEFSGVVLTASVTHHSRSMRGTVFDAKLKNIRAPALIASHKEDGCFVSPFEGSFPLKKALTGAPSVEIKGYLGGSSRGRVCGARAHHGFRGIEAQVVGDIAAWVKRQAAQPPVP